MFEPQSIGIDFRPGLLRIARPDRAPHAAGVATDLLRLPPDASDARRMIAKYVAANRLEGHFAWLGVPAETVFLNILPIPADGRARAEALRAHLDDLHAMSGSETVSDTLSLPSRAEGRRTLVGIARRDALCTLLEPLQTAGIEIVEALPASLAFYNLAADRNPRDNPELAVLCPIAGAGVEVMLGAGRHLRGVWRLPPGLCADPLGEPALQALAEGLEADRLAHRPARQDRKPTLIWCAQTPLPDPHQASISRATGLQIVTIAQWHPAGCGPQPEDALARGLVLSASRGAPLRLNLLPSPMREQIALRRHLPGWTAVAVLFLALSTTLALQGIRRARDMRRRLDHTVALSDRIQALRLHEQELQAQNADMERQIHALRLSAHSPLLIRDLLDAIARARHPDDWIVRIADAPSYFERTPTTAPALAVPADDSLPPLFAFTRQPLIVEGYTPGDDLYSVRALIETLRVHPQVAAVDLLGDDKVAPDTGLKHRTPENEGRRFVMEISLRES